MNETEDINALSKLMRLTQIMSRVSRVSFLADQAKQRYPNMERMTKDEIEALTRLYLALGFDFEEAYKDWKRLYDEYTKSTGTKK